MATNSEERLMIYKEKIYDFLEEVVNGNISGSKIRRELENYKKEIAKTLSFETGKQKKALEAICQNELEFINSALNSKAISSYINAESIKTLKSSKVVFDSQNQNKDEQTGKNSNDNNEQKEDLNKIHVRRVSEIEERLKELGIDYDEFIKNKENIKELDKQIEILNKFMNEYNEINKELSKITNKTVRNTRNVLPNVKNEEDRKRWEQENRDLLNKINSLIPKVQSPLLTFKNEIATIEERLKYEKENQDTAINAQDTVINYNEEVLENEQDNNTIHGEAVNEEEKVVTEDEYYFNMAKDYMEEEMENESIPYESLLSEEELKKEDVDLDVQEETSSEILDDNNNIEEKIEQDDKGHDVDSIIPEDIKQGDEIKERIRKHVNISKLRNNKEIEEKLDQMYDYIVRNIEKSPKKYRQIRKVFKRIFYDEVEFNGDKFTSNLFDGGMPQYLGENLSKEDIRKFNKAIGIYKQISITGKIPKEEMETFDKLVLAPYELNKVLAERQQERDEEENNMIKDLKSQTVEHSKMSEPENEIIDEDDFEIVDDIELEDDELKM